MRTTPENASDAARSATRARAAAAASASELLRASGGGAFGPSLCSKRRPRIFLRRRLLEHEGDLDPLTGAGPGEEGRLRAGRLDQLRELQRPGLLRDAGQPLDALVERHLGERRLREVLGDERSDRLRRARRERLQERVDAPALRRVRQRRRGAAEDGREAENQQEGEPAQRSHEPTLRAGANEVTAAEKQGGDILAAANTSPPAR
jgi:hypothetical protein